MGAKKLEAAEKFKTKQIDEDGLLEMIRSKPGKKSSYDVKVTRIFPPFLNKFKRQNTLSVIKFRALYMLKF